MTLFEVDEVDEVDEVATRIREEVDQEALEGVIRVSVVATGIDKIVG
ncbi:MAG: hypothetical protein AB7V06_25410 [Candidatus Obscuribacterales bacterium]